MLPRDGQLPQRNSGAQRAPTGHVAFAIDLVDETLERIELGEDVASFALLLRSEFVELFHDFDVMNGCVIALKVARSARRAPRFE